MGSPRRPRAVRPQHATALFFLALFTLAAAGACTDILGINDRTLTGGGTDSSIMSGSVPLSSTKGTISLAGANTDTFTSATQASAFSALNAVHSASVTK